MIQIIWQKLYALLRLWAWKLWYVGRKKPHDLYAMPKRLTAHGVRLLDAFAELTDTRWEENPELVSFFRDFGFTSANAFGEGYPPFFQHLHLLIRNDKPCCALGIVDSGYRVSPDFWSMCFNAVDRHNNVEFVISSALKNRLPEKLRKKVGGMIFMYYSKDNPPKGFEHLM